MIKVDVKWRGAVIEGVETSGEKSVRELKEELEQRTGVETANQKLLFKGKLLKDSDTLAQAGLAQAAVVMLMGTPSAAIPRADPLEPERAQGAAAAPAAEALAEKHPSQPCGLVNLGNSCYLNASLQALMSVPEVLALLRAQDELPVFLKSISELSHTMQTIAAPSTMPIAVLMNLHQRFPHFAQKNEHGFPAQQDAEECWSLILDELFRALPAAADLFTGQLVTTLSSAESGESQTQNEPFSKLSCHIAQNTADLYDGIRAGLKETISKQSAVLGRSVDFDKSSSIAEFPPYLCVNFVRFFWKAKEQVKAKILKKVKYPLTLDLSQFSKNATATSSSEYELISIVTHMGRSADSGHYIGWHWQVSFCVDGWWKCDDEKVLPVSEDEVKKLDGGGDWHIAYLCVYRRKEQ